MWAVTQAAPRTLRYVWAHTSLSTQQESLLSRSMQASLILLLILGSASIVVSAGGTSSVYPHLFYIPVILAAYVFGVPGALAAGLISGLICGPIMPLNVEAGTEQATASWLYRLGFFTLVGLVSAGLRQASERNLKRHADTTDELFNAYGRSLATFANLVALRDEQTSHHCERVAANAVTVGRSLGLDEQELRELYWEGILHDLGKVAVPTHVLLKPDKLTPTEFDEVKKHAKLGAEILCSISPRFEAIADGVRSHHERWDGTGYPDGLAGTDIPLSGRILAVVDVFEAITSDRPYRGAMTADQAVNMVTSGRGTHFDPDVVDAFLRLFSHGKILMQGDRMPGHEVDGFTVPGIDALRRDAA